VDGTLNRWCVIWWRLHRNKNTPIIRVKSWTKCDLAEQMAAESLRSRPCGLPPAPPLPIALAGTPEIEGCLAARADARTRENCGAVFAKGKLDPAQVDLEVRERSPCPVSKSFRTAGLEEMDVTIKDMLSGMFGQHTKKRQNERGRTFLKYLMPGRGKQTADMPGESRAVIARGNGQICHHR